MSTIRFDTNASAPGTPPAGELSLYAKNDDRLYHKNDAGVETVLATAGVVGGDNVVYVETAANGGSNATGTRGDPSKPYETLAAAIAVCVSGDILRIGVGDFSGNGVAAAWPAGLDKLTIIGSGCSLSAVGGTVITNTANDGSHIFQPPNTADYLEIRDLYASVTAGTGRSLYCNGTGGGGAFLGGNSASGSGGLVLKNVVLTGAVNTMYLLGVGLGWFDGVVCSLASGTGLVTEIATSNILMASRCAFADVTFSYDDALAAEPASLPYLEHGYRSCTFGVITCTGTPNLNFDVACVATTLRGSSLTFTASYAPKITFAGLVGTVDFYTGGREWPETTVSQRLDLPGARITTSLKARKTGTGGNVLTVDARRAVLPSSASTVEAGEEIILDIRGAVTPLDGSNLVTSTSGLILPSTILKLHACDGGGSPDTVSFGFTASAAPNNAQATGRTTATAPLAITGTSATGVTLAYAGAGTDEVYICAQWY